MRLLSRTLCDCDNLDAEMYTDVLWEYENAVRYRTEREWAGTVWLEYHVDCDCGFYLGIPGESPDRASHRHKWVWVVRFGVIDVEVEE